MENILRAISAGLILIGTILLSYSEKIPYLSEGVATTCGIIFILISIWIAKIINRYVAKNNAFNINEEYILYIRPFKSDKTGFIVKNKFWPLYFLGNLELISNGITRYEELLAFAFCYVGEFVAIGNPDEELPLLGSKRLYFKGDLSNNWQENVLILARKSRLIVIHIGFSGGLKWEIEKIIEQASPEKLIICIDPFFEKKYKYVPFTFSINTKNTWYRFYAEYNTKFPKGLPKDVGESIFVIFNSDWEAVPCTYNNISKNKSTEFLRENPKIAAAMLYVYKKILPAPLIKKIQGIFIFAIIYSIVMYLWFF